MVSRRNLSDVSVLGALAAVPGPSSTGASSATRYIGGTTSGAPASGTFVAGDVNVAQNGHIWVCTVGGTPGTWVDAGAWGASAMSVSTVTGTTTAANNTIYLASGTFTITLPAVVIGNHVIIKNTGTGTITVAPPSGTIDGAANFVLDTQYESIGLYSDATNYWVV